MYIIALAQHHTARRWAMDGGWHGHVRRRVTHDRWSACGVGVTVATPSRRDHDHWRHTRLARVSAEPAGKSAFPRSAI
eukprot:scaffold7994_cov122-Isochrysis_galbana.AAC.3